MYAEDEGYFAVLAHGAPGSRYGFRLEGHRSLVPDPASRSQPEGPHGLSAIVDPDAYVWSDAAWRGLTATGQVIYELTSARSPPRAHGLRPPRICPDCASWASR